jgi:FSR family fosmidomycin resistance protein-like MFS transporter
MQAVVLLFFGFVNLSSMPVMLAIVQEQVPNNRAVGNGLFMAINFLALLLTTLVVGAIGDAFGLRVAFYIIALAALLSIPAIFLLPAEKRS